MATISFSSNHLVREQHSRDWTTRIEPMLAPGRRFAVWKVWVRGAWVATFTSRDWARIFIRLAK